jgi:hypothetical protein
MLRSFAAALLGIALCFSVPSAPAAQTALRPIPVPEASLGGRAFGAWNLPNDVELGHVRGLLVSVDGKRFALEAKLVPAPLRDNARGGRLVGVLLALDREGNPEKPVAEVLGSYAGGPEGYGQFEATILTQDPEPTRLGRIGGRYGDPRVRGKDPVGRFAGRWMLVR